LAMPAGPGGGKKYPSSPIPGCNVLLTNRPEVSEGRIGFLLFSPYPKYPNHVPLYFAGLMFWFMRNRFAGSYRFFTFARRS
jgi:hypothetical protein